MMSPVKYPAELLNDNDGNDDQNDRIGDSDDEWDRNYWCNGGWDDDEEDEEDDWDDDEEDEEDDWDEEDDEWDKRINSPVDRRG